MFGDIFVLMVALLLGGPLVIGYVATRLARRRQGAEAERPMTSGAPRLSVAAFASGLLWLAAVPMILVARDAQDWLVSAGLVPGPPGKTAPIVIATGLALLGFVLGVTSLYQITRQPESLRGKGYAWTGVVLSWCVGLPLIVLGVPRARVSDHVEGRCGQNVAWLVSGVHAYAEDHGGSLPPADSWLEVVGPYLDDEKGPQGTTGNCRYAYNAALSGRKLADLRHPGRLVAVFETTPWGDMEDPWAAAGNQQQLSENPGHLEGDYYGFADGDHRWLARRRLPDGAWGKEPEADWVVWEP